MGQTRPVRVIKLASQGTVDERVVQVAQSKLQLQGSLLSEGGGEGGGSGGGEASKGSALMGSILKDVLMGA